jgi:small subunit ribosomal protein S8
MAMNDPVSDMIARIRNGQAVRLATVNAIYSGLNRDLLKVLEEEGFISGYEEAEERKGIKSLNIKLRYFEGQPVIKEILRVSKPGRRVSSKIADLPKNYNGLGLTVVSTSKGVMADYKAREANVGGEVICKVF